jgi:hypothetical protein
MWIGFLFSTSAFSCNHEINMMFSLIQDVKWWDVRLQTPFIKKVYPSERVLTEFKSPHDTNCSKNLYRGVI